MIDKNLYGCYYNFMSYIVVLSTINNIETAKFIAKTLIEQKLAACVNIVPNITSIYSWKDELCEDSEVLLIIKSKSEFFNAVKSEIEKLHPYEVPEVISFEINNGSNSYLSWLDNCLPQR